MNFFDIESTELRQLINQNVVVVINNGKIKYTQLPIFGQIVITVHDSIVTFAEKSEKSKF